MTVKSFNSNEDFLNEMLDNQKRAEEYMKSVGNESHFDFGEYFCMDSNVGILIFGKVINKKLFNKMDFEEQLSILEGFTKTGYVMTESFSLCCLYGELGDQHQSRMIKITEEEFELCKTVNFKVNSVNLLKDEIQRAIELGFSKWIANINDRKEAK